MNFFNLSVQEFLNKIDSPNPTPGGGSVSAAAIAYGIGLLRMVAHITMPKKKFQGLNESVKADYRVRLLKLEEYKKEAIALVDLDSAAFDKIMAAYRLDKNTEEEIARRNDAIKEATVAATEVPLRTARIGLSALETAFPMFSYASKSALSDFGVGVLLLEAGIKGAVMNVKTNLLDFSEQSFKETCHKECARILESSSKIVASVLTDLDKVFG